MQRIQQYTVEAARSIGLPWVFEKINLGGVNNALLLACIDARSSAAELAAFAITYLNKDQRVAIEGDAIDFTTADSVVAREHVQAGAFEMRHGQIFRLIAGKLFGGTHVILRFHSKQFQRI